MWRRLLFFGGLRAQHCSGHRNLVDPLQQARAQTSEHRVLSRYAAAVQEPQRLLRAHQEAQLLRIHVHRHRVQQRVVVLVSIRRLRLRLLALHVVLYLQGADASKQALQCLTLFRILGVVQQRLAARSLTDALPLNASVVAVVALSFVRHYQTVRRRRDPNSEWAMHRELKGSAITRERAVLVSRWGGATVRARRRDQLQREQLGEQMQGAGHARFV